MACLDALRIKMAKNYSQAAGIGDNSSFLGALRSKLAFPMDLTPEEYEDNLYERILKPHIRKKMQAQSELVFDPTQFTVTPRIWDVPLEIDADSPEGRAKAKALREHEARRQAAIARRAAAGKGSGPVPPPGPIPKPGPVPPGSTPPSGPIPKLGPTLPPGPAPRPHPRSTPKPRPGPTPTSGPVPKSSAGMAGKGSNWWKWGLGGLLAMGLLRGKIFGSNGQREERRMPMMSAPIMYR